MESNRFDAIARTIGGRGPSRRAVLRSVVGGLAAAGLAAGGAEARSKKKKKCKGGLTRCGKKCVDLTTNARHCGECKNACSFDIDCVGGACQCRELDADCVTDGQCCSGKCSTEVISTCRKFDCVETGACGADADCCGGFCVGGCCQGIC